MGRTFAIIQLDAQFRLNARRESKYSRFTKAFLNVKHGIIIIM